MLGTSDVVKPRRRISRFDIIEPPSTPAQSDRPEKHIPTGPKSMPKSSSTVSEQYMSRDAEISSGAASTSSKGDANGLTRELWDVRRQMTALKAREETIQRELQRLRVPVGLEQPTSSMSATPLEDQRELKEEISSMIPFPISEQRVMTSSPQHCASNCRRSL